jgi:hypothetical protein
MQFPSLSGAMLATTGGFSGDGFSTGLGAKGDLVDGLAGGNGIAATGFLFFGASTIGDGSTGLGFGMGGGAADAGFAGSTTSFAGLAAIFVDLVDFVALVGFVALVDFTASLLFLALHLRLVDWHSAWSASRRNFSSPFTRLAERDGEDVRKARKTAMSGVSLLGCMGFKRFIATKVPVIRLIMASMLAARG